MTFQRAKVNCRRCYDLLDSIVDKGINLSECDQMYDARNECMRALEDVCKYQLEHRDLAFKALDACESCDYSRPEVVITLNSK